MLAEGLTGSEFVFLTSRGTHLTRGVIQSNLRTQLKAAGLPRVRFHALRHTNATMMLGDGVHPKIAQERLGHATIQMTLDTYSHVLPSMQAEAADRMQARFKAGAG